MDGYVTTLVKQEIERLHAKPRERSGIKIYASSLGDLMGVRDWKGEPAGCPRKVYLDHFPEQVKPAPTPANALLNMDVGNAFHDTITKLLWETGMLVRSEYPMRQHAHISGRADWLVWHPELGVLPVEGKSMSAYAFDKATSPKAEHVAQLAFYIGQLKSRGGMLLYFNKENGRLKEFWVDPDAEVLAALDSAASDMVRNIGKDKLAGTLTPPPIPEGAGPDSYPCWWYSHKNGEAGSCKFYAHCHGQEPPTEGKPKPRKAPARRGGSITLRGGEE